jgi:hypothetical protein
LAPREWGRGIEEREDDLVLAAAAGRVGGISWRMDARGEVEPQKKVQVDVESGRVAPTSV